MKQQFLAAVVCAVSWHSAFSQSLTDPIVDFNGFLGRSGGATSAGSISAMTTDGRYVLIDSSADNIIAGDTNGRTDVFVKDMASGWVVRESVSTGGAQANGNCQYSDASSDLRYIVFHSDATNLVPSDTNGFDDVFLRDRVAQTTLRLSVGPAGIEGNGYSQIPRITPDGRYVLFTSRASNLVVGDTNGWDDAFLYDTQSGSLELVSLGNAAVQGNSVSYGDSLTSDARYVAFTSVADNFAAGDVNQWYDVFLRDRQSGTTTLISTTPIGAPGDRRSQFGLVSDNGSLVAFMSESSNLIIPFDLSLTYNVYVRDVVAGTTTRLSVDAGGNAGNGQSFLDDMTPDGRYVAYQSRASNLDSPPTNAFYDAFLLDRQTGVTREISHPLPNGQFANNDTYLGKLTPDGQRCGLGSYASNASAAKPCGGAETFVWSAALPPPPPVNYCVGKLNSGGCTPSIVYNGSPSLAGIFCIGAIHLASNGVSTFPGLLIHGANGRANIPFSGGTLCIALPVRRAPGIVSQQYQACGAVNCNAMIWLNMTAFATGGFGGSPLPALTNPGSTIDCQWWTRDLAGGTQLSDGIEYVVAP